ncbi:putative chitin biosynthesis protein [Clavispora lusitaniae]|uniref:Chitin biosynthesis protein n=1 Tax=Clavispora lusitaniae TaxID=36911 RepID=A0ACD0WES9_CLALS|nr:Chitin synthase, class 5 [Clavispora lusitaniae]KAF7584953.1 BRCA1 C Terminus (BRCT) domain family protein [Clavispora lusitaniae]QFZ25992.1 putative chitin biosynthesis protein [Clavispora lusitaniae]QFZ30705.1 putative chitin biosynthesis protein [Clavispora lusitaniae]QFZ36373.1 putative chitin biosynthesis protein [Clavispora lusitaniae]
MVEVSLTVGKLDASLALLLTKDHHLIEFPTILLPNGVKAGSIVKIKCERDLETEEEERRKFQEIQDEILTTFGKNLPKPPVLKVKNVTQTSCVLEWDPLDLGTATLKNLVLFKDDKKLGSIHQPLSNRTTKLSGLPIDKTFKFQLRLDTTAGVYSSKLVEVKTHKMTDLSGITVCLGDITANDQFTVDDIQQTLKNMGAHYPAQEKLSVDTTHFITTRENKSNPEYMKANEMNIPIIRPEWLKACERERRIVGVRDFYVKDCVLPDILAKDYWKKNNSSQPPPPPVPEKDASNSDASVTASVTDDNEMHEDSSTNVNEKSETISQTPEETKLPDSGLENPKEEAEKNLESAGQPSEEPIEASAETFEQIPLDEDRVSEAPEKEELPDATEEEPKESSEKVLEGEQTANEGKESMDLSQAQEKVEAKDAVSQKAKASNNDDYSEVSLSETAEQNVDADTTEAVDLTEPEHATDPTDLTEQAEINHEQALDEHAEEKATEDSQTEADMVHVTEDKPDEAGIDESKDFKGLQEEEHADLADAEGNASGLNSENST